MKILISQLRAIISEEITNRSSVLPKIVLGGVYCNDKHQEINIQFLDAATDVAGYEILSGGRSKTVDNSSIEDLKNLLVSGGFELDHVQTW